MDNKINCILRKLLCCISTFVSTFAQTIPWVPEVFLRKRSDERASPLTVRAKEKGNKIPLAPRVLRRRINGYFSSAQLNEDFAKNGTWYDQAASKQVSKFIFASKFYTNHQSKHNHRPAKGKGTLVGPHPSAVHMLI